jgi:hypothetical protein
MIVVVLAITPDARAQDTTTTPGVRLGLSYAAGTKPGVIVLPVQDDYGDDSLRVIVQRDLDYLAHLGVKWLPHPTREQALAEYERIWSWLNGRSIEDLIELPLMSDPAMLGTLDVLTEVVTPALFTDENLLSLVICRMVNLSLEHGNSDGSCFAYVFLGMIAGPHFDNYEGGFQFGRLGYALVEKRSLHRYRARTYMAFGSFVMPWTRHVRAGRDLIRRAFDVAKRQQMLAAQQQKERERAAATAAGNESSDSNGPNAAAGNPPGSSAGPVAPTPATPEVAPGNAAANPKGPTPASVPSPRSAAPQPAHVPAVGRNDPCPCGSGQKYKKCHGKGG